MTNESVVKGTKVNEKQGFSGEKLRAYILTNKTAIIRYMSFFLVVILFGIMTGGEIFSQNNLKTIVGQTTTLLITSVGVLFLFSTGSMDISSGAVGGLCAMLAVLILNSTGSLPLAVAVSLTVSVLLYLFSMFVSVKFGLMSTVASLAVMFMARGIVTYVCSTMPSTVINLNRDAYLIINKFRTDVVLQISFMAVIALLCWVLYSFTKLGKHARAIGDNPVSAAQSGVKISLIKYLCSAVAGLCVGIMAIFLLARSGSITKNTGSGMEMDVMVAMILGGMPLSGGAVSRFSSAVIGALTFRMLSNGMTMAGVPTSYVSLIRGVIFLAIVFLTLRQAKHVKEMPR